MKRFKLIFHISYVIIALMLMYFSIDIMTNMEAYLDKIKLSTYLRFPKYVMAAFLVISILMVTAFILERVQAYRLQKTIKGLRKEITDLRAGTNTGETEDEYIDVKPNN